MKIIAQGGFNTGRLYTEKGQRIYWTQLADGWLHFYDIDRMGAGWIDRSDTPEALRQTVLPGWLMQRYDNGRYEYRHPDYIPAYQLERGIPAEFDYGEPLRI